MKLLVILFVLIGPNYGLTEDDMLDYLSDISIDLLGDEDEQWPMYYIMKNMDGMWKNKIDYLTEIVNVVCGNYVHDGNPTSHMVHRACSLFQGIAANMLAKIYRNSGSKSAKYMSQASVAYGNVNKSVNYGQIKGMFSDVCKLLRQPQKTTFPHFDMKNYEEAREGCNVVINTATDYLIDFQRRGLKAYDGKFYRQSRSGPAIQYQLVKSVLPMVCDGAYPDTIDFEIISQACTFFVDIAHDILMSLQPLNLREVTKADVREAVTRRRVIGLRTPPPIHDSKEFIANECKKPEIQIEHQRSCEYLLKDNMELLLPRLYFLNL